MKGTTGLLTSTMFTHTAGRPTPTDGRWSETRAWTWYESVEPILGSNYLPRTAVNSIEMWQAARFDPATIDEELGWAQRAQYNSVRVFLQYVVWKADPEGFKDRMTVFLDIAEKRGIRVLFVPFCDCAFGKQEPTLAPQPDPIPGVHNSRWVPSPGLTRVTDRDVWPDLRRYIQDLVSHFGQDARVLAWDLYNEPGNSGMGTQSLPLAEAAFTWARAAAPTQPLTIGAWTEFRGSMSQRLLELSDVISFHAYDPPEGVQDKIALCEALERPLICTEFLHRQSGNTLQAILPIFAKHRVGWYHWGLVAGRTQTYMPWGSKPGDPMPQVWQHDVFHPNGEAYDTEEMDLVRAFHRQQID